MLDRNYIPGVAIYYSNNLTGKYRFLIPAPWAVDCYMGDANQCDANGTLKPGYECPSPFNASDFGDKFKDVEY